MRKTGKKLRIRAILSDWGRVVVNFDNRLVGQALAHHSTAYDAEDLHRIQFEELRETFDAYMRGQLSTEGYRRTMRRALQLTCKDAAFDAAFSDVFTLNEPIVALWKRLRADGVKLVAASNLEPLRHDRMIAMGVPKLFDELCLSYLEKCGKPQAEFFHRAMKLAYIDPREALFVDDHPEFVEAAEKQLINGFTYDIGDHAAFERWLDEHVEFAPYRIT